MLRTRGIGAQNLTVKRKEGQTRTLMLLSYSWMAESGCLTFTAILPQTRRLVACYGFNLAMILKVDYARLDGGAKQKTRHSHNNASTQVFGFVHLDFEGYGDNPTNHVQLATPV